MINIPFNHQPESISVKTGSYTIPAGKFARVTVSLSVSARGRVTVSGGGTPSSDSTAFTSDSMSKTATFFVPSGSVLDIASSAANSTASGVNTAVGVHTSAISTASFSIDSVDAFKCEAGASCATRNTVADSFNYVSANVTGSADARYTVELFSEIS